MDCQQVSIYDFMKFIFEYSDLQIEEVFVVVFYL